MSDSIFGLKGKTALITGAARGIGRAFAEAYVREGAITHEDSLGNTGRTEAGDVQVISAGAGIRHAEYNREDVPTTLFQIWIEPSAGGGTPSWGTKPFPRNERAGDRPSLAHRAGARRQRRSSKARILAARQPKRY